jgi:hypothetical protein
MLAKSVALAGALALISIGAAQAQLTISNKPTRNVTCSSGMCSATASGANLNASDLVDMLSASDVSVKSGSQAEDMALTQALTWSSSHKLTLDSFRNLSVQAPLISEGSGSLALTIGDGADGFLTFLGKGRIAFWDLNSTYTINGFHYALVGSIATLANDIQSNSGALFALADDYDASADGVYQTAPVPGPFNGNFTGNGNTIGNLTIHAKHSGAHLGLFEYVSGTVTSLHFVKANIRGKSNSIVGTVAASVDGAVTAVSVSGKVTSGSGSSVGGLVGQALTGAVTYSTMSGSVSGTGDDRHGTSFAGGLIGSVTFPGAITAICSSSAIVTGGAGWRAGGLIGSNASSAFTSFASGKVSVGDNGFAGGLIGESVGGNISNTYATGFTGGGVNSTVGGLIGHNQGPVATSYSSGAVASGSGNAVGGLIGNDSGSGDLTNTDWDVTTSGQAHGVGNDTSYPGVTGLTTAQFQAGLPAGFDPATWAENADINGGLPYLSAWPPN